MAEIGTNVATRARSFGMKVIAYDPYIKKSKAECVGAVLYDNLVDLLKEVDILPSHTLYHHYEKYDYGKRNLGNEGRRDFRELRQGRRVL